MIDFTHKMNFASKDCISTSRTSSLTQCYKWLCHNYAGGSFQLQLYWRCGLFD